MDMNLLQQTLMKLGLEALNPMQEEARLAITHGRDIVILSPTGSGKTLAFLLPIIEEMDKDQKGVQTMIIAPSRELAIQIEAVARNMATGYKVNVIYGGRPIKKDFEDLATLPALLIGTPGRIGDHLRRGTIDGGSVQSLIIDEYDKSLELGFEEEMSELISFLPNLLRRILTSATQGIEIPEWINDFKPLEVNYLGTNSNQLIIKRIVSEDKDKLDKLLQTLRYLQRQRGIIFLNFKDSIRRTSNFLKKHNVSHGVFYGGLDQHERERALIQFRNGTFPILLATDLAARGLDVPELDYILHYHLPLKEEEFTHRNGRTARMHQHGAAYVLHWRKEQLPEFVPSVAEVEIGQYHDGNPYPQWKTLFISGGRRDKISKGDIAGFCMKVGGLKSSELGLITLKQDCAFVAVEHSKADDVVKKLNDQRLKKRKVRVNLV